MKTQVKISKGKAVRKPICVSLFVALVLMISIKSATAQVRTYSPLTYGVGYSSFLSGNGHGTFYSFTLNVNKNKNSFSIGPCIQKTSQQISTVKVTYSYQLAEDQRRLNLRVFSYLLYADNLPLSFSTVCLEERQSRSQEKWEQLNNISTDWSKVKLSTIETGMGVEVGVRIMNGIVLRNFIGLSVFYHTQYTSEMYSDKIAPVLMVGTSLNIFNNY